MVLGVLFACAVGCLVYWGAALWQTISTLRSLPTARAGLDLPVDEDLCVCLVVPAHNEEEALPRLVRSLRAQDLPNARFVLALDRCTDGTASAARSAIGDDDRFEIIEVSTCPEDWAGKVNAAWMGVQQSQAARQAEVLVFTDADCVFEPGCLRACAALLEARKLDLLSLLSTLRCRHWFEHVCQPAAMLELMRLFPLHRANRNDGSHRAFANGQFMMFRAEAYHRVGGHEAVREALLEDIAFARLMTLPRHGMRTGLLLADGMVRCAMYETWQQFRDGWKRILIESCGRKSSRLRSAAWRGRLASVGLPTGTFLCLLAAVFVSGLSEPVRLGVVGVSAAGLIVWLTTLVLIARAAHAPVWSVPLHVIGGWLVGAIELEGACDLVAGRPTRWGGREYVLEDRS